MNVQVIMKTARSMTLKLDDGGIYDTKQKYTVELNGEKVGVASTVISSFYGLKPDTEYTVEIFDEKGHILATCMEHTKYESVTLNVREFGAQGNGVTDDTAYIQAAILACPADGRVLIPRGRYQVTAVFLKSNVAIEFAKDAVLVADTKRTHYPILPGMIQSYDEKSEYNLGSWEGNPLPMYASILTGIHVKDVVIYGEGSIDGAATYENWWYDEKVMRGAFRPRLLFLNHCSRIQVQGLNFHDSPAWVIHPYFSEQLQFINLKIENPQISPNTDGIDPESCKDVEILGVHFSLGDDCIAVKSGKIYMGRTYKVPSENIHISQCLMENGHGAVTVGSEMAGGVKNLLVDNCRFYHTDRGLRIKTRRGRGKDGIVDQIVFRDLVMDQVMTPFTVNCFYFCDPDGKSDYVQSRQMYAVDERTPRIKRLCFERIEARNCHVAAAYFEGLPEQKIEEIQMKQIHISFADVAKSDVPIMSLGVIPCTKQGIFANNVTRLVLQDVTMEGESGDLIVTENVDEIVEEE